MTPYALGEAIGIATGGGIRIVVVVVVDATRRDVAATEEVLSGANFRGDGDAV
jgi:hypothetical protein